MEQAETSPLPRHPFSGLIVLLVVLAMATACGSGSAGGGAVPSPSPVSVPGGAAGASGSSTVEIDNFMFMAATLTVPVGTTVTWRFDDSTQHTVAANDKSFSSPPMAGGQTYAHTFTTAGTVSYHCSIHPFMTGTIVVR